jgi:SAM-dependent methyltransferase
MNNPFDDGAFYNPTERMLRRRIDFYRELTREIPPGTEILDIGEPNLITGGLNKYLWNVTNTEGDLNFPGWLPDGKFQFVFCFEVLEHLQNPLLFLREVRDRMPDGGKLYLTTPMESLRMLRMPFHFIEYDRYRLMSLFDLSGCFRIEEIGITGSGYPWFIFWRGLRPFLRAMCQWSFYLEVTAV